MSEEGDFITRMLNTTIFVTGLVILAGCSSPTNQPAMDNMATRLMALERERQWLKNNEERLMAELEAATRRNVELEQRVDELSRSSFTKAKQDHTEARRP